MKPRPPRARGFTLVEMLLVIVIIGILAGAIVASLSGRSQEARITRAQADMQGSLSLALDLFDFDNGRYPTADEGLQALVENPGMQSWKGPYLKGGLKPDPWGNPYQYTDVPEQHQYTLRCNGPDGQANTSDDVVTEASAKRK